MTQPRFVNNTSHPVYIRDPNGHQRVVRPFRELGVIIGRKEEDCVCYGEHYGNFPGLLEPFPGSEPDPSAGAAVANPMDPNDPSIAARAQQHAFHAAGDVISPSGEVKRSTGDEDPETEGEDDGLTGDEVIDVEVDDDLEDDADADYPEDAELVDVKMIGDRLAANLQSIGIGSAAALAAMQDDEDLEKLRQVDGVRNLKHARQLVEHAQTLLGWTEEE
tara:strand:+ start:2266 stop:2922 length:657 start_codon:yes stop_codon:yes gene_type:complete